MFFMKPHSFVSGGSRRGGRGNAAGGRGIAPAATSVGFSDRSHRHYHARRPWGHSRRGGPPPAIRRASSAKIALLAKAAAAEPSATAEATLGTPASEASPTT
jgi:hypothetical protein